MIVTANAEHAATIRMLRAHGSRKKYCSEMQGWNSRLDELQAAILRVKLPHLDRWNALRASMASRYDEALRDIEGVTRPTVSPGRTHVFHQYTIRVSARDSVQAELARVGVQTAVYYPIPLHRQPMYSSLAYRSGNLPVAEQAAQEVLSLPIYPELEDAQMERVVGSLRQAVERSMRAAMVGGRGETVADARLR
jgi:dTDP-4-amino-4,6-dideoxygalactose transaminase